MPVYELTLDNIESVGNELCRFLGGNRITNPDSIITSYVPFMDSFVRTWKGEKAFICRINPTRIHTFSFMLDLDGRLVMRVSNLSGYFFNIKPIDAYQYIWVKYSFNGITGGYWLPRGEGTYPAIDLSILRGKPYYLALYKDAVQDPITGRKVYILRVDIAEG